MRAEISMNLWMVALCAFSTDRGYGGPVPRIIFCCECMLFMFINSLRGFWLDLFSRNRFLWMHLFKLELEMMGINTYNNDYMVLKLYKLYLKENKDDYRKEIGRILKIPIGYRRG